MQIGTAETINDLDEPKRRSRASIGGPHPPGGGGGGRRDPGGGGDRPDGNDGDADTQRFLPDKSRVFTAFLLLIVLMTFGGLMAAYLVIATNRPVEWNPFDLPIQVW